MCEKVNQASPGVMAGTLRDRTPSAQYEGDTPARMHTFEAASQQAERLEKQARRYRFLQSLARNYKGGSEEEEILSEILSIVRAGDGRW